MNGSLCGLIVDTHTLFAANLDCRHTYFRFLTIYFRFLIFWLYMFIFLFYHRYEHIYRLSTSCNNYKCPKHFITIF